MALPQAKIDATEARLATVAVPEGSGWLGAARQAALTRLRAMGLPARRDEYWRFTPPDDFLQPEAQEAALFKPDEAPVYGEIDRVRLVFVDGVFDAEQSDSPELAGVEISRLSEVGGADIHWARDLYGVLEARGQDPVERPFAALNTATATDGVLIRVTGKADKPINLTYLHDDPTSDATLHHVVRVEAGAEVTVLENGPAAARFNKCMEIDVAEGGAFHHIRAQGRDHERRAMTHMFARVAAGATYKSFTLTVNGVITRNEQFVEIVGDEAVAHIAGAALGGGTGKLEECGAVHARRLRSQVDQDAVGRQPVERNQPHGAPDRAIRKARKTRRGVQARVDLGQGCLHLIGAERSAA